MNIRETHALDPSAARDKKRLAGYKLPVLLATASLIVTACSSGSPNGSSGTPSSESDATASASETATTKPESSEEVLVATWGGSFGDWAQSSVAPILESEYPHLKPVYDLGDQIARIAKLKAEAQSGRGTMDVVGLPTLEANSLAEAGLLMRLSDEEVPNLQNIKESVANEYCVPRGMSVTGIIYNAEKVQPAPTSFADLWDPKYRGKIGFAWGTTVTEVMYAAAAVAKGGMPDGQDDWEASWPEIERLVQTMDPKTYPNTEALGNGLATGEVWMGVRYKSKLVPWAETARENDITLEFALPKEGAIPHTWCVAIPANAPNPDQAKEYLNAVFSPEAQRSVATEQGYEPVITNADLSPEWEEIVGSGDAMENNMIAKPDYEMLSNNFSPWLDRLEKIFKQN